MINFQMIIHTYGKLPNEMIRDYISIRYERWLDYSKYKCSLQKMDEFAIELLDEVLLNLLQRDEQFLLKLYNKKKIHKEIEYRELDFFILRAINLNVSSDTAPFRHKYKPIPADKGVKLERLKIVDNEYSEIDRPAQILKEMRLLSWVLKGLDLTESERRVFEHRFMHGNSLCGDWDGPETRKQRYRIYKEVETTIHHVLFYYGMTGVVPKGKLSDRQSELADRFVRTHRIKKNKQSNQLVNI